MEKIIIFGYGLEFKNLIKFNEKEMAYLDITEVWDNDINKQGMVIEIGGKKIIVTEPHKISKGTKIYISSKKYEDDIKLDLSNRLGVTNECYVDNWILYEGIKQCIIKKYRDSQNDAIKSIINYLRQNSLYYFFGGLKERYLGKEAEITIYEDNKTKLLYSYWNGKKMYMKRGYSKYQAQRYINSLLMEQDDMSPHYYGHANFDYSDKDILVDIGAAEGFFALDHIDKVKKVILIEGDSEWLEALHATFNEYGDKVEIINKYIASYDDDRHVSLDSFKETITIIKMDIEGAEMEALSGAADTLKNDNLKIVACSYHRENDDLNIAKILLDNGFLVKYSPGYMYWGTLQQGEHNADLRHGLVIGCKNNEM